MNEWVSEYLMPESLVVFSYAKEINYCAVHIANYITYTHACTVSYRALHWEVQTPFACDHYLIWSPVGMPWINPCATKTFTHHLIHIYYIFSDRADKTHVQRHNLLCHYNNCLTRTLSRSTVYSFNLIA